MIWHRIHCTKLECLSHILVWYDKICCSGFIDLEQNTHAWGRKKYFPVKEWNDLGWLIPNNCTLSNISYFWFVSIVAHLWIYLFYIKAHSPCKFKLWLEDWRVRCNISWKIFMFSWRIIDCRNSEESFTIMHHVKYIISQFDIARIVWLLSFN